MYTLCMVEMEGPGRGRSGEVVLRIRQIQEFNASSRCERTRRNDEERRYLWGMRGRQDS